MGNTALGLVLLIYATRSRLLAAAWGQVTLGSVLLGALAGLVPLTVILVLIFRPGQLGHDIVASGLGAIPARHVAYRLCVQVGLTTVLCEEFAFRGVLQVLLLRTLSVPWALGLDGVVFGLWHAALLYNGCTGRRGVVSVSSLLSFGSDEGAAALGLTGWPDVEVDLEHSSLAGIETGDVHGALVFGCGADVFSG